MRETTLTLDGIMFEITYRPETEESPLPGQSIKKGIFKFDLYGMEENELDLETAKRWLPIVLEKRLLDYLLSDNYDQVYEALKVNKLSIDVAMFELEVSYYNMNDDQSLELVSYNIFGNSVKGRKYVEGVRAKG